MLIQRRFVQIDGRNVHYRLTGDGSPVILIHPSPYSSAYWLRDMAVWGKHFTCIAVDTPGFGDSDPLPPEQMDVDGIAAFYTKMIQRLGVSQCAIVGSHTGAAVALEVGGLHPELVRGLVLEAVPIFTDQEIRTGSTIATSRRWRSASTDPTSRGPGLARATPTRGSRGSIVVPRASIQTDDPTTKS